MLDILWTWAVLPCRPSFLHNSTYSQHALLCSALAAKRFYPEARRRFLVDRETYDLLDQKGWLDLWDSVELIDFPKDRLCFKHYYATPKIYTYRFAEGPTLILDAEAVAMKRLEYHNNGCVQGPTWLYEEQAEKQLIKWFSGYPDFKRDFFPTVGNKFISASFFFLPSQEIGRYVSDKTLDHLDHLFKTCRMSYGSGPAMFLEDGYISHCFEEICGIEDRSDEWWGQAFYHEFGEKWEGKQDPNRELEKYTGEPVWTKYFQKKTNKLL